MAKIPERLIVQDKDADGYEVTVAGTPGCPTMTLAFKGNLLGAIHLSRDTARKVMRKLQSLTDARRDQ